MVVRNDRQTNIDSSQVVTENKNIKKTRFSYGSRFMTSFSSVLKTRQVASFIFSGVLVLSIGCSWVFKDRLIAVLAKLSSSFVGLNALYVCAGVATLALGIAALATAFFAGMCVVIAPIVNALGRR